MACPLSLVPIVATAPGSFGSGLGRRQPAIIAYDKILFSFATLLKTSAMAAAIP
jgi:hypothetical protein